MPGNNVLNADNVFGGWYEEPKLMRVFCVELFCCTRTESNATSEFPRFQLPRVPELGTVFVEWSYY